MAVPPLVAHVFHQPTPDLLHLSASEAPSELIHHVGHGGELRHPRQVLEEASAVARITHPPSALSPRSPPSCASSTALPDGRMHARKQAPPWMFPPGRACNVAASHVSMMSSAPQPLLRAATSLHPSLRRQKPELPSTMCSSARCVLQAAFVGCTLP